MNTQGGVAGTPAPQLPNWALILVGALCALPFLLNIIGLNLGTTSVVSYSASISGTAAGMGVVAEGLSAGAIHTILEWSAFCVAFVVFLLAMLHYSITREISTPIICMALFCSGTMDAFHVLAANGYITDVADNQDFIAFTWTMGRLFNAVILIMGASLFLGKGSDAKIWEAQGGFKTVLLMSLTFGTISFAVIYYCSQAVMLPQMFFPNAWAPRPWDAVPLILFLIAGITVYPRFYRKHPSLFTHALLVSTVPYIIAQVHAAYGSVDVFDKHAHYASFLKIVAYSVPLLGLMLDYRNTYKESEKRAADLARSNEELEQFAYIASHDLQEPLRKIVNYAELLERRYEGKMDESADRFLFYMSDAARRMRRLIQELLAYSRVGRTELSRQEVDLNVVVDMVVTDLEARIEDQGAGVTHGPLPKVWGNPQQVHQLMLNLIGNGLKYRGEAPPEVRVTSERSGNEWIVRVEDNGIGINPRYFDKIFAMFQRLHSKGKYSGTGIGLAMCKKIVDTHGGRIWVESEEGKGSSFYFSLPANV